MPSCIACTRAIGISCPSATRSALSGCGAGNNPAHGTPDPETSAGTVCTVKSAGVTLSRSSHGTGNETVTPGRARGLYTAATVAPCARVESRKTFPSRSSLMNAVVARAGSSRSARTAMARVAAAASSALASIGTYTCAPLAPLVLTAPVSPTSASACRTSRRAATTCPNSPPDGGSMSSTRYVGRSGCPARNKLGWYSTARWFANHSSVRRSLQSA